MERAQATLAKAKPAKSQSTEDREAAADDFQLQNDLRRISEREKSDKVCKLLESKTYLIGARIAHILPRALLEERALKDQTYLEGLPTWNFSRYYMREKIVVDLFPTQSLYDSADVEARRAWCRSEGLRYGALGPDMNTTDLIPQMDELPTAVTAVKPAPVAKAKAKKPTKKMKARR